MTTFFIFYGLIGTFLGVSTILFHINEPMKPGQWIFTVLATGLLWPLIVGMAINMLSRRSNYGGER